MNTIPAGACPANPARTFVEQLLAPTTLPHDETLAVDEALSSEAADIAEAKGRVAEFQHEVEHARNGRRLSAPGCETGCAVCFRACAVAKIKLDWWQRELTSLVGGLR